MGEKSNETKRQKTCREKETQTFRRRKREIKPDESMEEQKKNEALTDR